VYVDGTEEASASYAGAINTTNSNPLRIGADRNNSSWYNGYLDDFRITKGVARYTSAFTPAIIPPMEVNTRYIGQIGGWDDIDVDYGVKKISNSQISFKRMSAGSTPDRLYVNVQKLGAAKVGQGVAFNQLYTGDGTTTNYLLADSVSNTQDLLVSVQGFVQTPNIDYTLAGTTGISFTTGITSGDEISLRYLALGLTGAAGPSGVAGPSGPAGAGGASSATNRFTGNGVISGFEMTRSVSTADEIFVYVNGLFQDSGDNFTITNGTGLYFASGDVASGDKVVVRHIY
jgi:hypothetical protein